MAGGLRRCGVWALLSLGLPAAHCHAQLTDPTRPPPARLPEGDALSPTGQVPTASGLQSVILKRDGRDGLGRPAALINGRVVEIGGKVGEQRLVKVAEDHVILLGAEGRETLRLLPAVEKTVKVGAGGTAATPAKPVKGETKK